MTTNKSIKEILQSMSISEFQTLFPDFGKEEFEKMLCLDEAEIAALLKKANSPSCQKTKDPLVVVKDTFVWCSFLGCTLSFLINKLSCFLWF